METQDKSVQIVYEGSRSFRNYGITVDVTVINLLKFGMYEVLIRDHESQCAIAPIYLRSPIIKESVQQNLAHKRIINAGQSRYSRELADDDDDFKSSVYNYIADRLTIKRRPVTSVDQYVIEYVSMVNDPERNQEKKIVCNSPYSSIQPVSESEEMVLIPKVFKSVANRNTFAGAVLRSIGLPWHAIQQLVLRYRSERVVVPFNSSDCCTVLVGPSTSAVLSSAAATARRDPDSSGCSSQQQFSPLRGSSEDVSIRAVTHLPEHEDGDTQTHCDSKKLIEYNLFHLNAMPDNTGALLNSEVFFPHMKIPKHKSIKELCDPKVIERIPDRQHVFMPQPSIIRGLIVDVTGDFELYESSKTQHYNEGSPFNNSLPFITAEEMASLIRGDRRTLSEEYGKKETNFLHSERQVASYPLAAEGTPEYQQQQQSTTRDGV